MEVLNLLGSGMIILGALSGVVLYIHSLGVKIVDQIGTIAWLFIFCIIGGTVCYNLSDNSIDGIIYSSYILLMLGSLSGLTLFFIEFGFKKFDKEEIGKGTLWLFFLLFVPIGIAGILNYKLIELINQYSNQL